MYIYQFSTVNVITKYCKHVLVKVKKKKKETKEKAFGNFIFKAICLKSDFQRKILGHHVLMTLY